ncbi:MAG: hypothetical protein GXO19_02195 [Epsilonproteobacteria bacterium]|nr:hypothetical protein [Campylobacterota bacterium]NPA56528.1 hypothetical protein [Campylobacterota bacterium]
MGYQSLILLLLSLSLAWGGGYPDIDQIIEKIKVPRQGLTREEIAKLKNPFIGDEKLHAVINGKGTKRRKKIVFRLESIFSNRARINGRWYRVGSKVGNYRLVAIGSRSVVLQRGNRRIRLFLWKRTPKLKLIKIER